MKKEAVQRCYGLLHISVVNMAGVLMFLNLFSKLGPSLFYSELQDPQKLLPLLLQPEISNLSPDIISVYIQAATKIFGFWAADLASRWSDDDLQQVKDLVQLVLTGVGKFVASPHIEVQERVSN